MVSLQSNGTEQHLLTLNMTKAEIQEKLDELEVEYPSSASKSELVALLEEQEPAEEVVVEEVVVVEAEEEVPAPEVPALISYEGLFYGPKKLLILQSRELRLNGVDRVKVLLADGTSFILSESELEAGLVK